MDEEITRLFRVRRTVLEMLRDRSYNVQESDLNLKRDEFIQKFGNPVNKEALFIETNKGPNPADKMYVFFPVGPKVGVPVVRDVANKMKADNVLRGIVVVPAAMSAPARAAISQINKILNIEVFEEAELVNNITEHKLINEYYVLDDKAKKELLAKYRVQETQVYLLLSYFPQSSFSDSPFSIMNLRGRYEHTLFRSKIRIHDCL
ncbi:PREDICTED: DNA-directed RNA polymerase subunit 5-like protein 1 isoform X1 [Tarenaya hassleriana]|uniref:DNA-directed RNA polymerase subunit 5-like protein 1 isoform X1 n=1 Tax=Tarenaya hassleriana TaxID=28532 RepID=UPI00053CA29F|nr:PREDICTED: DNA-directed RNA polymerase subunit 5-like protein 1 isoform X1 [Tarenaya hassleriana]